MSGWVITFGIIGMAGFLWAIYKGIIALCGFLAIWQATHGDMDDLGHLDKIVEWETKDSQF